VKERYIYGFISCLILFFAFPAGASASSVNLVDGATVSLIGDFSGSTSSYINDGFVKTGTQWSKNSVWWQGTGAAIEITLNGAQKISSISIQADSNDEYRVDYWDAAANSWKHAFTAEVTKTAENSWLSGLDLRKSDEGLNIFSDRFRVSAVSGDNNYSISEVQAHSAPTPIPATLLLFGGGLGGVAFLRRKFFNK